MFNHIHNAIQLLIIRQLQRSANVRMPPFHAILFPISYPYDTPALRPLLPAPCLPTYTYDTPYAKTPVHSYGKRYYSPELGRWISRDPITERGDLNLYGFVHNNLVSNIDFLGLLDVPKFWLDWSEAKRKKWFDKFRNKHKVNICASAKKHYLDKICEQSRAGTLSKSFLQLSSGCDVDDFCCRQVGNGNCETKDAPGCLMAALAAAWNNGIAITGVGNIPRDSKNAWAHADNAKLIDGYLKGICDL